MQQMGADDEALPGHADALAAIGPILLGTDEPEAKGGSRGALELGELGERAGKAVRLATQMLQTAQSEVGAAANILSQIVTRVWFGSELTR